MLLRRKIITVIIGTLLQSNHQCDHYICSAQKNYFHHHRAQVMTWSAIKRSRSNQREHNATCIQSDHPYHDMTLSTGHRYDQNTTQSRVITLIMIHTAMRAIKKTTTRHAARATAQIMTPKAVRAITLTLTRMHVAKCCCTGSAMQGNHCTKYIMQ